MKKWENETNESRNQCTMQNTVHLVQVTSVWIYLLRGAQNDTGGTDYQGNVAYEADSLPRMWHGGSHDSSPADGAIAPPRINLKHE